MTNRRKAPFILMMFLLSASPVLAQVSVDEDVSSKRAETAAPAEMQKNYIVAVDQLRPAADKGDPKAQTDMGALYQGDGKESKITRKDGQLGTFEQDFAEAMKWYRKAADQGYAPAQYKVGLMFQLGEGVKQDYAEEMKWCQKAAAQGYAPAQAALGDAYFNGRGVALNYEEALKWLQKAADQGDANALLQLGWMYRDGKSVKKDYIQAYLWIGLAVEKVFNNETLIEERDEVAAKLKPEQLAEAKRLAAKWKETHTLSVSAAWLKPASAQNAPPPQ